MIDFSPPVMQGLLLFVVLGPLAGAALAFVGATAGGVTGSRAGTADTGHAPRISDPAGRGAGIAPTGRSGAGRSERTALGLGVVVTGTVLAAAVALALGFDRDHASSMQATTDVSWIAAMGVRIHLGIDGISLPLLVLTALLTFLCAVHSFHRPPQGPSPRAFVALLLLLESGTLATFAVLDLILFFLAFETVLIPMYFLIARWGGDAGVPGGRQAAAWRFVLYTVLGSLVMLLGLLLIGLRAGTFDMVALATDNGRGLGASVQVVAALAIGLGLAVKAPMWPLHSWLPDAHTAAPTVGSVLLAGVLLKMGTYGFVRIVLPIVSHGMHTFAPYLGAFGAVGIVYGSLACLSLARRGSGGDLKRLIAYSSVGHMGFVLLGIATLTPTGVNGALFANVAHGLITGLLFFLVGSVKERYGTADLDTISGATGGALYGRAPRLGGLLAFAAVASLGLPGLAGFWGEMLSMFGSYTPGTGLSRGAYLTYLAAAGFGTLLTAAYLLVVVRRVCMGAAPTPPYALAAQDRAEPAGDRGEQTPAPDEAPSGVQEPEGHPSRLPDVRGYELAAFSPLVALTVLAGLWPAVLLALSDPAVHRLLAGGAS